MINRINGALLSTCYNHNSRDVHLLNRQFTRQKGLQNIYGIKYCSVHEEASESKNNLHVHKVYFYIVNVEMTLVQFLRIKVKLNTVSS